MYFGALSRYRKGWVISLINLLINLSLFSINQKIKKVNKHINIWCRFWNSTTSLNGMIHTKELLTIPKFLMKKYFFMKNQGEAWLQFNAKQWYILLPKFLQRSKDPKGLLTFVETTHSLIKVAFIQKVRFVFQISKSLKKYSKLLSWAWNLNLLFTVIGGKFILQV